MIKLNYCVEHARIIYKTKHNLKLQSKLSANVLSVDCNY